MYTLEISPRFVETDALGHINNTIFPQWFELAREPIFKLFTPDLDIKKWKLIIAHISCDFHKEVYYGKTVTIETSLEKIGNSSMHLLHYVYQDGHLCCTGKAVMIHYNHQDKHSVPLPDSIRSELNKHLQKE